MVDDIRAEELTGTRNRVRLTMEITRFRLPPVESALVIGRRASIGPKAMEKALGEMLPGAFVRIDVEHPTVESVILRESHLRRVPKERLVPVVLRNCENLMDETDMLHVELELRVRSTEELEI